MGLVVLRHCENRYHCDTAVLALLPACALIYGRKVSVHISGITASAGNLFARGRNLSERIGIVGDIRQYDKHMHASVKGEILRRSESHLGCCDTLDGGVVRKV